MTAAVTSAEEGTAETVPVVFVPAAPMMLARLNPAPTAEQSAVIRASLEAVQAVSGCRRVILLASAGMGLRPDMPTQPTVVQQVELPPPREPADDPNARDPAAPAAVLVGAELLGRCGYGGRVAAFVACGTPEQVGVAPSLTVTAGDGLLVVGDGTATRHEKAPGHVVDGAVGLDRRIASMLASADLDGLLGLSADMDDRYLLDGRPAWQAAAHLIRRTGTVREARLLGFFDPQHVAYFVAEWSVAPSADVTSPA